MTKVMAVLATVFFVVMIGADLSFAKGSTGRGGGEEMIKSRDEMIMKNEQQIAEMEKEKKQHKERIYSGSEEGSMPPGLKKQNKIPEGLKKQNKTPRGWMKGKKKGWGK